MTCLLRATSLPATRFVASSRQPRPKRTPPPAHCLLDSVSNFLLVAPILLFSMVAHEYAHGYAALRQGDSTAYQLGRLTWNPLKHIDPVLTVLMPLLTYFGSGGSFVFGGAKPVPVIPRNYRNYRRGDIIVSLAGVATNFVLAIACTVLVVPLGLLGRLVPFLAETCAILQVMLVYGIFFNLLLVVFNLLPLPPLDGSHVVKHLLPPRWAVKYQEFGRYGIIVLLLLLTVGRPVLFAWMTPVIVLHGAATALIAGFIIPSELV